MKKAMPFETDTVVHILNEGEHPQQKSDGTLMLYLGRNVRVKKNPDKVYSIDMIRKYKDGAIFVGASNDNESIFKRAEHLMVYDADNPNLPPNPF